MWLEMNELFYYLLFFLGQLLCHEVMREYTGLNVTEYLKPIVTYLYISYSAVVVGYF